MNAGSQATLIYDGECVFCANYVRLVRLRDAVGDVRLVDARSGSAEVRKYVNAGYDLNEGMLFVLGEQVYYGAAAINVIAGLSSPTSAFNRLNRLVFSNAAAARLLYPILKLGRRIVLFVRGKGLIVHT